MSNNSEKEAPVPVPVPVPTLSPRSESTPDAQIQQPSPSPKETKNNTGLPELTLKNLFFDLLSGLNFILNNPQATPFYYLFSIIIELVLCKIIIHRIPYTEIDFSTYMQQIQLIKDGELNYANVYGDSGPIVYPGGYVLVYSLIESVYRSDGLRFVQKGFGWLLTGTVLVYAIVCELANGDANGAAEKENNKDYKINENKNKNKNSGSLDDDEKDVTTKKPGQKLLFKKPWVFALLLLSKRIHSIYLLRLFNDCFVTFSVAITILLLQLATKVTSKSSKTSSSKWPKHALLFTATSVFSFSVSIKMNSLLLAPGFYFILYLFNDGNLVLLSLHFLTTVLVQVAVAWPFLQLGDWYGLTARQIRASYLSNAFDFSRKFMYKWTINWRFLPEEVFLGEGFHRLLLGLQVGLLVVFALTRWCGTTVTTTTPSSDGAKSTDIVGPCRASTAFKMLKKSLLNTVSVSSGFRPLNPAFESSQYLTPAYILYVLSTSNLVGILCSRSLHYQFLSWYYFQLPFLYSISGWDDITVNLKIFGKKGDVVNRYLGQGLSLVIICGWHVLHELCWCTYPSSWLSSLCLVGLLVGLLGSVWYNDFFENFSMVKFFDEKSEEEVKKEK